MQPEQYFLISAVVFGLVATAHLMRIIYEWHVQIGPWIAPMSVSWAVLVIAGFLFLCAILLYSNS